MRGIYNSRGAMGNPCAISGHSHATWLAGKVMRGGRRVDLSAAVSGLRDNECGGKHEEKFCRFDRHTSGSIDVSSRTGASGLRGSR